MADKKISDLNAITGANTADGDLFVIVDTSANETKSITKAELFNQDITIGGNLTVQGTTITVDSATAQTVDLGDNDKIRLGDGDDLQIYHDSGTSHSYIAESGSGHLFLQGTNIMLEAADGSNYIYGVDGEATYIYHPDATNGIKLKTQSTGIDVTGTVTADGLTVDGDALLSGTTASLTFIETDVTAENTRLRQTGGDFYIQTVDDSEASPVSRFRVRHDSGDISFYGSDNTERFYWDRSVNYLGIGTSNPIYVLDVNSSSAYARIRDNDTTAASGTNSGIRFEGSDAVTGLLGNFGSTDFRVFSSGDVVFASGGASTVNERMRINSSGNVGIGTDDPKTILHSYGTSSTTYDPLAVGGQNTSATLRIQNASTAANTFSSIDFNTNNNRVVNRIVSSHGATTTDGFLAFITEGSGVTAEAMRIDSSGNLLVGQTTANYNAEGAYITPDGYITACADEATANTNAVLYLNRKTTDGDIIKFYKNGAPVGSIGAVTLAGATNTLIDSPNAVYFGTNARPETDNVSDLGSGSFRWDDVYATNGTIQTSDANEKQDIEELSEAEQRVAVAAKALLRKFRWKSKVEEKGDEARIHFGIIAQDLQAAFEAEGLDAGRYAMFIHTTWTDEETGEERSRMGVRYSELLAFIIAAL